jgi:hypothetical protein
MNEDIPTINESDFNAQFGGASDIPTINESDFNRLSAPAPTNAIQSAPVAPTDYKDRAIGALKGVAEAGTDVVLAPADLLMHLGNSALDYMTGETVDPKGSYPTDLFAKFLNEDVSGGEGNKTAETATHIVGDLAAVVAAPSQAGRIAEQLPTIAKLSPLLAKVLGFAAEGAGYSELGNPKGDLITNAETGAAIGAATPAVSSLFSKVLGYLPGGASRKAISTAQDVVDEIRSVIPDALTEAITPAERAAAGSKGLEVTGSAAKSAAGQLFKDLPEGSVALDSPEIAAVGAPTTLQRMQSIMHGTPLQEAAPAIPAGGVTQSIKDFAEKLSGPILPGSRTAQLVNYLENVDRVGSPAISEPTTLERMQSIFHGTPLQEATPAVAPRAVVDVNQFQNILRDVGTIGDRATGAEAAIISHAKSELLKAGAAQLPAETNAALTEARSAWREMAQTFQEGGVGKARESLVNPNKGTLALRNVLMGDPKGAEQVASVMAPHEIANAQNLMLSDLLRKQPISWARSITTKIDNYNAIFGEEGTQKLVDMMSRDGTIGKKLLTDNVGLKAIGAKLVARTVIGGALGQETGHPVLGALAGAASLAGGNGVTRVQQLLMRAAAGEPGALAILNAPASQLPAKLGSLVSILSATAQKESSQQSDALPIVNRVAPGAPAPTPAPSPTPVKTPSIFNLARTTSGDRSVLPDSIASYLSPRKNMGTPDTATAATLEKIRANPYYHAAALTESNMKADAVPRDKSGKLLSSAKGLFQLTDATAKNLGVKDPFNAAQNFEGMEKLTAENTKALGTENPETLYAAHVLGAPLTKKWLAGKDLTEREQELVDYFLANLPRFRANYAKASGVVEA